MNRKLRKRAAAATRLMNAGQETSVAFPTIAPPTQPSAAATPDCLLDELRRELLQKFQPAGPTEHSLVEEMIHAQWKQRCLARIEETAYAQLMSAAPADLIAAFENRAKLLASLDRLRKSSAAQFSRALATLTKLRVPAKAPQPAAPAPLQTKPTSPAVPPRPTLQFPDFFELDMPQNLAHAIDHSAHLE